MGKDKVYEELEEVNVENEKLRVDFKSKVELCEHMKKEQIEQVMRIREASLKIEKLEQQLLEKEEEIASVKGLNEDLKCRLNDKESIVKHLNAANDKLRADREEKNRKSEQENRRLLLALDESNEMSIDQEQKINVLKAEIEGLKADLSISKNKRLEAEKKVKNPSELKERDDLLVMVEEEKRKVEDQLKWKEEQFKHLEEAHEKLRERFKASKKEWEQEKSTLFDEVSSLQTKLDSQIRVTKDLQNRLGMCNQALACEETRRKNLEVEVSEFKTRYENIFSECQDTKSQLDCLNSQRNNEVATLRHMLATKESFYKETEYRAGQLEQENRELLASLKELQEARIQEAGSFSSLSKLKNKLKTVEQVHKECSKNLRAKQAEWNSQKEEMNRKLNDYSSRLQHKDAALKVLKMELEGCLSSAVQLKLQNEENSVMLLVLKSGMSEAQLKLANVEAELGLHEKESAEKLSILRQQLEVKDAALANDRIDIAEERERMAILSGRVDTVDQLEDKHQLMEKELNRCKEMLEESSRCQLLLKKQALQVENDSKEKIREVCDALDAANSELAEERENVASLLRKVESDLIEGQRLLLQKELERYKELFEEASMSRVYFEEQAVQMENESKDKLQEVCDALETTRSELTEEREKTASLMKRVESLDQNEERWIQTQEELESHKEMLEEACRRQCYLEEQPVHVKKEFREKLQDVCDALETAKIELTAERERTATLTKRIESSDYLEEQLAMRQQELDRYKEMFEESSRCQLQLEEQISRTGSDLERELKDACNALEKANAELIEKTCEGHELEFELRVMESIAERLKVDLEESQALRKELEASLLAQVEFEETIKNEKEDLVRISEEKDGRIVNFQQQLVSLLQEKSLSDSIQLAFTAEAELEAKHMEIGNLTDQMESRPRKSEALVDELKGENRNLLENNTKLSTDRENLLGFITSLGDRISEFSGEDAKLMGNLRRILQSFDNNNNTLDMKGNDKLYDILKENNNRLISSPATRKSDSLVEERSPFRELN